MKARWAFNSATVMHLPWKQELQLLERFGWRAAEVWYDKFQAAIKSGDAASPAALARQARSAGIEPIGVCAGMVFTDPATRDRELADINIRLDFTAEIGAPSLTVVCLGDPTPDYASAYSVLADKLRAVAEAAAARKVRVNVEFLGGQTIVSNIASCVDLIRRIDHPSLGMLLDLVHYYVGPSHMEDLERLPAGKLHMIHIDDSPDLPIESLKDDQRVFPGEGRIDLPRVLAQIESITQYDGYHSVELYDETIWKMDAGHVFAKLQKTIDDLDAKLAIA